MVFPASSLIAADSDGQSLSATKSLQPAGKFDESNYRGQPELYRFRAGRAAGLLLIGRRQRIQPVVRRPVRHRAILRRVVEGGVYVADLSMIDMEQLGEVIPALGVLRVAAEHGRHHDGHVP